MNKVNIIKMISDKKVIKNFYHIHQEMKKDKRYKIINMIKCGLNVIKNDRVIVFDDKFIINSFIPPINSQAFYKIAFNVENKNNSFFDNHIKGIRKGPISTYFAVNNSCHYNCWHCSALAKPQQNELSTQECLTIIRKLHDINVGIIGFTGGEPLLRDDLEILVKEANNDTITLLFTTGYQLTKTRAQALKDAGLFGIGISIDSHQEEVHNQLRGHQEAFKYALEAIKVCKEVGLYTMAQIVATNEMFVDNNFEKLAKLLKELAVAEMRILEPLPCGNLKGNDNLLSAENRKKLIEYHTIFNHNKEFPKASVFPYFESEKQFGCGAGIQHSYVSFNGDFKQCDFLDESYGNLITDDSFEIWNKMHKASGNPKSACLAKKALDKRTPLFYKLMKGEK